MRSVNKVILIGNVTRDPEVRKTQSGQSVCTFGLATNREWVTSDSRRKSSAEYHEVVAWARLADICEKYVRKGKLLYIEGYLKTRSWDTPEGIRKFKTEVVVQDMIMLEKRREGEGAELEIHEALPGEETPYMEEEYDMHGEAQPQEETQETSEPTTKEDKEDEEKKSKSKDILEDDLGL